MSWPRRNLGTPPSTAWTRSEPSSYRGVTASGQEPKRCPNLRVTAEARSWSRVLLCDGSPGHLDQQVHEGIGQRELSGVASVRLQLLRLQETTRVRKTRRRWAQDVWVLVFLTPSFTSFFSGSSFSSSFKGPAPNDSLLPWRTSSTIA